MKGSIVVLPLYSSIFLVVKLLTIRLRFNLSGIHRVREVRASGSSGCLRLPVSPPGETA